MIICSTFNRHTPSKRIIAPVPILKFSSPGFGSFNQIMSILVKDKFLFSAATLPREVEGATLTNQQLTEVLKVSVSFMAGGQNKNGRLVKS